MDYRFIDKDPTVDVVRTLIAKSGMKIKDIAVQSGVSHNTITRWLYGDVRKPQNLTLKAVLASIGYELVPRNMTDGREARSDQRVIGALWRRYNERRRHQRRRKVA